MEITWHGQTHFTIKGAKASLKIDALDENASADILTFSDTNTPVTEDGRHIFSWPGEYEARGVLMTAIEALQAPTGEEAGQPTLMFHYQMDNIKLAHLAQLGTPLSDDQLEAIGNVDILMIPVGGGNTLDAKAAHNVVEQIDPRVVIPMAFENPADFLKEVGASGEEQEESYKVKGRSELPDDTTRFVMLVPQG